MGGASSFMNSDTLLLCIFAKSIFDMYSPSNSKKLWMVVQATDVFLISTLAAAMPAQKD